MIHLLLDLYGCPSEVLASEELLRRFLEELPAHIQMEQLGPVELRYIGETSDPRDAGYSGLAIHANSHCSLHAWPPYGMVNIDIFSCDDFDRVAALAYVAGVFHPADMEQNLIQRATRSPRPGLRTSNDV